MRRLLTSLLLFALILPILAACGTANEPTTSPAPAASPDTSSEASPTPFVTEPPDEASPSAEASPSPEASPDATTGETATPDEGATAPAGTGTGEGIRVGLVTDIGKVNDGTFNQSAYEGLVRAQEELGVETDFIETQRETDYETNLERFAGGDYDLVIGVGFLMGDAMATVASRHPDVNFAIVDFAYGENPPENVKGLVFREDQGGYLAGTMAGLISQNANIGVVGGLETVPAVKNFVEGYKAGALAQNPDMRTQEVFIDSFTAPDRGAEAARSQIAEGADVIFGAGGQTGSGAIQGAAQQGAYVIGVDKDEYLTTFNNGAVAGADRLVTSALKRVDNAVFDTIQSIVNGTFSNELYVGDAENGGIDYAECHDACAVVTDEIRATMDQVKAGLADGSIETGID